MHAGSDACVVSVPLRAGFGFSYLCVEGCNRGRSAIRTGRVANEVGWLVRRLGQFQRISSFGWEGYFESVYRLKWEKTKGKMS